MWTKVAWIFMWMTLAFWVGCGGENQNFKLNLEPTDPLHETNPTGAPGTGAVPIAPTTADVVQRKTDEEAAADRAKPSLTGIDRSHWAKISVAPDAGLVPHHPAYFNSESLDLVSLSPARPSALRWNQGTLDLDASADAATSNGRAHFDLGDARDLFVAPLNTGYELITLPAAAVVSPPWDIEWEKP